MKRILSLYLLLAIAAAYPSTIEAQDENYDAVYLSLVREYTLNPDGSMDYRYAKKQKLQTYRAFHNLYGETFVVYNPAFQKLKINEATTLMADGKKVVAPANAFNEVLPAFAANAPAFNVLREMVITHTGLERNAIVNLDYTIASAKGFYASLSGNEIMAETEPVKELVVRVRIPAGEKLYYRMFNANLEPSVTTEGKWQVYSWTMTNIGAIPAEDGQPGTNAAYPRLIFSTTLGRDATYNVLTGQPAFRFETDEGMRKELNILMSETKEPFDIALKLQDRVINETRLYQVPLRFTGGVVRTAPETRNSNGGTLIEKAVLLTAMLKAAGIEAAPVAVIRTPFFDGNIGTLTDIEDFLVKAEFREQGTQYLSLNTLNPQNLVYTLPDRTLVSLKAGGPYTHQRTGESKQKVRLQGTFIVSSDPKITGELSVRLERATNPFLGLSRDKNKVKNGITGGLRGKDLSAVKVSNITPESTFQTFTVMADHAFRSDTGLLWFSLPSYSQGIDSWNIKTLSSNRTAAYEIPAAADEIVEFEFTLPSTLLLFTPETRVSLSNKAGSFLYEVGMEGGKLKVRREIRFKESIYGPDLYKDFKVLMDNWNNPRFRELIFSTLR
jgi:hypothetical protein